MTFRQKFATFVLAASVLGGGFVAVDTGNAGAAQLPTIAVAATTDSIATSAAAALATMGTPSFALRFENAAYAVAASLEVDAGQMHQAWLAADQLHQIALLSALTQVGVPYHRNSSKAGVGVRLLRPHRVRLGPVGRRAGTQQRCAASQCRRPHPSRPPRPAISCTTRVT